MGWSILVGKSVPEKQAFVKNAHKELPTVK